MIDLFCGYDQREAPGYHVFVQSVITRASVPVNFRPLASMGLPQGSNTFTLSRFLVPYLMNFKGHAIFVDACDMLMLADAAELDALFDPQYAVQVVKHPDYQSQHERKYIGTEMECEQTNYSRKNWMSVSIFNCGHSAWFGLTPRAIAMMAPIELLQLQTVLDHEIGELPPEWNVLIDEGHEREGAKILHWSSGIPQFRHYQNARASKDWFQVADTITEAIAHG